MKLNEHIGLWLAVAVAFCGTVFLKDSNNEVAREKYLNPPPEFIEHFHFGFSDSAADSLWLRWIQDSDYCQTYLAPVEFLNHDPKSIKDTLVQNPRHKKCDNSWSFKMLDAVTRLAPRFEMPYLTGAMSLSVLVEDYEGATIIFDRAIKQFPEDWRILYRAAYHFLYDRQDLPKAANLLSQSAEFGGPPWLKSLAARLYSRSGQLTLGIASLKSYREVFTEEKDRKIIDKRIRDLEAQLAKEQN